MSKRFTAPIGMTMAQVLEYDPGGTCYTFVETNGEPTHIASMVLYKMLAERNWPVTRCFIAPTLIHALKTNSLGVEEPHAVKLPEAALEKPALVCEWGSDHVIADGNHRLWRRWKRGDKWFPAYVVPEAAWRHFTILGMPGTGEFWAEWNKTAKVRTPEMERLLKLLTGG
jgi:hypothetical protein